VKNSGVAAVVVPHNTLGGCIPGPGGGVIETEERLIESLAVWPGLFTFTKMPLAVHRRGIASLGQEFSNGDLFRSQASWIARKDDIGQTGANGMSTSHQGNAGRRTGRFGIEAIEQHSVVSHAIDLWRGHTAHSPAALNAQFAVADVVGKYIDDVRFLAELLLQRGEFRIDCLVLLGPLRFVFLLQFVIRSIKLSGHCGTHESYHRDQR